MHACVSVCVSVCPYGEALTSKIITAQQFTVAAGAVSVCIDAEDGTSTM